MLPYIPHASDKNSVTSKELLATTILGLVFSVAADVAAYKAFQSVDEIQKNPTIEVARGIQRDWTFGSEIPDPRMLETAEKVCDAKNDKTLSCLNREEVVATSDNMTRSRNALAMMGVCSSLMTLAGFFLTAMAKREEDGTPPSPPRGDNAQGRVVAPLTP